MSEPTVTINPTPSAELIAQASTEKTVVDSRGRLIILKKPAVLAQFRLVEALGDAAKNEVYMGMTLPLIFIASIDGLPVSALTKKMQVEALIQQLDEDGILAVQSGVQEHFGNSDPEADKAALKN